jgi:hypothetical protein
MVWLISISAGLLQRIGGRACARRRLRVQFIETDREAIVLYHAGVRAVQFTR